MPAESRWKSAATTLAESSKDGMTAVMAVSMRAPLRRGPRRRPPTRGDNEAIKAKELEARRQVALVVSPAEATTSASGSLTNGSDSLGSERLASRGNHLYNGQPHQRRRPPQHRRQRPPLHRWLTGDGGRLSACRKVLAPILLRG
jgi:hypothetical protein